MINAGFPYWAAFFLTVGISFVGGVVIERVIIRPFERAAIFTLIVVFIALLLISMDWRDGFGHTPSRALTVRSRKRRWF